MDIQYIGEHLFFGYAGRFFIFLSVATALFSGFAYFQASKGNPSDTKRWRKWGRILFQVQTLFVILTSFFLYYILLNRFYEYQYVWAHVENDLGLGYMIASFWAGQEGSFLFWALCQALLGLLLIRFSKDWENHVMTVFSLAQFFLLTMNLGIRIADLQIGISPFVLLREMPDNIANPFFQDPNYLSQIPDGNGLNPLLRNFWMMSHPPVLFVGFAFALVPYAYAISGLWRRQFIKWVSPALPWMHLNLLFLGAGIFLGGVWAYESLTFGGFWAWDPIENASLVPWMIFIAALHIMLVARRKKENVFAAFLFTILGFVFVIYSTYLTRSGILSETSVHSFGSGGMGIHILIYLFSLLILGLALLLKNYKKLPSKENDEPLSRQFWLFISAMVLILSAFQIIFTTSIPVINAVANTNLSPPVDVVDHYNTWQTPFAIAVAILMGVSHFLKWNSPNIGKSFKRLLFSLGVAVFLGFVINFAFEFSTAQSLFLFASLFAITSSVDVLMRFRNVLVNTPALITHLGFALFLFAVLLTFSQQQTISQNTSGFFLGEQFPDNENLLLLKDEVLPMGPYYVSYKGHKMEGNDLIYTIDFLSEDAKGERSLVFTSTPTIKLNEKMGNVYNPDTRVYWDKDIFTYITFADVNAQMGANAPELLKQVKVTKDIPLLVDSLSLLLTGITAITDTTSGNERIAINTSLEVSNKQGQTYTTEPGFMLNDLHIHYEDDHIEELELMFRLSEVTDEPQTVLIDIFEHRPDFIIIKSIIFPYINLLWFSSLVMFLGLILAFIRRWRKKMVNTQTLKNQKND